MTENDRDMKFGQRIRTELDQSLESLDPKVERQLLAGRLRALNQREQKGSDWFRIDNLIPAKGFAVVAAVVMVISLWHTTRPQLMANKVEELEVLTITASLDMYKDLEMLQWLAETDEKG
jgi:hypothetical protein